jgi:hypothetical protein
MFKISFLAELLKLLSWSSRLEIMCMYFVYRL